MIVINEFLLNENVFGRKETLNCFTDFKDRGQCLQTILSNNKGTQ